MFSPMFFMGVSKPLMYLPMFPKRVPPSKCIHLDCAPSCVLLLSVHQATQDLIYGEQQPLNIVIFNHSNTHVFIPWTLQSTVVFYLFFFANACLITQIIFLVLFKKYFCLASCHSKHKNVKKSVIAACSLKASCTLDVKITL